MIKRIKDIKVVKPGDKLIILVKGDRKDMEKISDIAREFMILKADRGVLVIADNLQLYIVRKGAKVSIASIFETMLTKEEEVVKVKPLRLKPERMDYMEKGAKFGKSKIGPERR